MRTINTYTIKLKRMKKKKLWMLAAILCSSLVMASCSNDDNAITAESAAMAKALEGEGISEIKVDEFMLEAAVKRDMTAEKPAWVINYSSTKLYNTVGMKLVDAVIKQN